MSSCNISLCRLCRRNSNFSIDIFDPNGTNGLLVWKIIKELLQLDVCRGDGLPITICPDCMDKVTDFKYFKTKCINSQIEFLKASVSMGLIDSEPLPSEEIPQLKYFARNREGSAGIVESRPTLEHAQPRVLEDRKPDVVLLDCDMEPDWMPVVRVEPYDKNLSAKGPNSTNVPETSTSSHSSTNQRKRRGESLDEPMRTKIQREDISARCVFDPYEVAVATAGQSKATTALSLKSSKMEAVMRRPGPLSKTRNLGYPTKDGGKRKDTEGALESSPERRKVHVHSSVSNKGGACREARKRDVNSTKPSASPVERKKLDRRASLQQEVSRKLLETRKPGLEASEHGGGSSDSNSDDAVHSEPLGFVECRATVDEGEACTKNQYSCPMDGCRKVFSMMRSLLIHAARVHKPLDIFAARMEGDSFLGKELRKSNAAKFPPYFRKVAEHSASSEDACKSSSCTKRKEKEGRRVPKQEEEEVVSTQQEDCTATPADRETQSSKCDLSTESADQVWMCDVDGCGRQYGSKRTLSQHQARKHSGPVAGRKTGLGKVDCGSDGRSRKGSHRSSTGTPTSETVARDELESDDAGPDAEGIGDGAFGRVSSTPRDLPGLPQCWVVLQDILKVGIPSGITIRSQIPDHDQPEDIQGDRNGFGSGHEQKEQSKGTSENPSSPSFGGEAGVRSPGPVGGSERSGFVESDSLGVVTHPTTPLAGTLDVSSHGDLELRYLRVSLEKLPQDSCSRGDSGQPIPLGNPHALNPSQEFESATCAMAHGTEWNASSREGVEQGPEPAHNCGDCHGSFEGEASCTKRKRTRRGRLRPSVEDRTMFEAHCKIVFRDRKLKKGNPSVHKRSRSGAGHTGCRGESPLEMTSCRRDSECMKSEAAFEVSSSAIDFESKRSKIALEGSPSTKDAESVELESGLEMTSCAKDLVCMKSGTTFEASSSTKDPESMKSDAPLEMSSCARDFESVLSGTASEVTTCAKDSEYSKVTSCRKEFDSVQSETALAATPCAKEFEPGQSDSLHKEDSSGCLEGALPCVERIGNDNNVSVELGHSNLQPKSVISQVSKELVPASVSDPGAPEAKENVTTDGSSSEGTSSVGIATVKLNGSKLEPKSGVSLISEEVAQDCVSNSPATGGEQVPSSSLASDGTSLVIVGNDGNVIVQSDRSELDPEPSEISSEPVQDCVPDSPAPGAEETSTGNRVVSNDASSENISNIDDAGVELNSSNLEPESCVSQISEELTQDCLSGPVETKPEGTVSFRMAPDGSPVVEKHAVDAISFLDCENSAGDLPTPIPEKPQVENALRQATVENSLSSLPKANEETSSSGSNGVPACTQPSGSLVASPECSRSAETVVNGVTNPPGPLSTAGNVALTSKDD